MEDFHAVLDLAPEELEELLARAAALAASEINATRTGPIFARPPSSDALHALFDGPLPREGEPLDSLLEACADVLRTGRRTAPAFFGYIQSPPSPVGVVADLLASAADQNVTAWRSAPAAAHIERLTLRWLGEFTGFDDAAAGIMVGGGSAANLTALLTAIRTRSSPDADRRRLVVYVSSEAHFSIAKAAGALGLAVRGIDAGDDWRLAPEAVEAAIARDERERKTPLCLVASAGTTATGAVDPLDALAGVAEAHGLWFHVDGAYGAPAAAVAAQQHRFRGIERADSLSIDAHKWLYSPVDCSALFVHDAATTARAFGAAAGDYVRVLGAADEEAFAFWDHGLELSRRFRALKLWMALRHYGADRLAQAIEHDIAMAALLGDLVDRADDLELMSPPSLSICTFRHRSADNERLLAALQRDGRVYLSNAVIGGELVLRACITNFRTTEADIERTDGVVGELARAAPG